MSTPDEFAEALTEFRIPLDDIQPEQLTALWEKTARQHEAWPAIQARAVRTRARGATPAGQWHRTCHSTARDH
ncbi:hypothetical protein [Saccharothrix luteola]|uniref:hypothetical protein n=1 Tax=Saccharothrix luteola TaxID=2893018 RepID=UPI001E592BD3|nr:hypothetical protein [Saccharothrix luteola]MCC8247078.1 hypothetical protein [Saccharothrix luteola]MCC8249881.1 hypothetical protein [Saccharothrix luteola]